MDVYHVKNNELHVIPDLPEGCYEVWNSSTKSYDITPVDRLSDAEVRRILKDREMYQVKMNQGLAKTAELGVSL